MLHNIDSTEKLAETLLAISWQLEGKLGGQAQVKAVEDSDD